jgi:hypothetical protein
VLNIGTQQTFLKDERRRRRRRKKKKKKKNQATKGFVALTIIQQHRCKQVAANTAARNFLKIHREKNSYLKASRWN